MKSSNRFNKKYFKKLTLPVILLLTVFVAVLFIFGFIINEVLLEKEEVVDNYIFSFLSANMINPHLTIFMKAVTYFASAVFLPIAYVAVLLIYIFMKNYKRVIEIAVIGIGGFIIVYFMKLTFHRIRPPYPLVEPLTSFSFPSGHATSGFIFYGLMAYLIWKTNIPKQYKYLAALTLVLFSLLIGFSRIYLRVHYASDVVAGFCVGFAWLSLTIWLFERVKQKSVNEIRVKQGNHHTNP